MTTTIKVNYADAEILNLAMESIFKKMEAGTNLTLLRYTALYLGDKIKPLYIEYISKSNELLFKHVEMDGDKPKEKVILDANGEKREDKFIWKNSKSKEKFNSELEALRSQESEISILKYDAALLLEQPLKMSDTAYITILKYIVL
jgi:hypothetical protein